MALQQAQATVEANINIKIKTLKSDTFDISISPSSTVQQLKAKISEIKKDIAQDRQRLIFRGKILKKEQTLKECGINEDGKVIHLVVKRPTTNENDSNTANNGNTQNNQNNAANPPNPHQQIFQMIQNMTNGLNPSSAMRPPQQIPVINGPNGPIRPQMIFRRVPMHINPMTQINTFPMSNLHHQNGNNDEYKEDEIEIKKADFSSMDDGNNVNESMKNVIKWKIKKSKIQQNWIANGRQYQCYHSDEYELNNGAIFRLFVYPNGINQNGYHNDCVLFIKCAQLPFGVNGMDIEFTLEFKAKSIKFQYRKTFSIKNKENCTGWPMNHMLKSVILELPESKKFVKFEAEINVHCVILNGKRMSNFEYIKWKKDNVNKSPFAMIGCRKPNGTLFRWKVNKKIFIESQFKQLMPSRAFIVGGFKFGLQLFAKGLQQNGWVQPYIHLLSMPPGVRNVNVSFSLYLRECNVGYDHIDGFDGRMGKGWRDSQLKFDEVKWSELKSITLDCRINILNVMMNDIGYYTNVNRGITQNIGNQNEEENEEKKEENESNNDEVQEKNAEEGKKEEKFKQWLKREVGLEQYFDQFLVNEIRSMEDMMEYIEEKDNLKEIGILPFAHRSKIWKKIVELKGMCNNDDEPCEF